MIIKDIFRIILAMCVRQVNKLETIINLSIYCSIKIGIGHEKHFNVTTGNSVECERRTVGGQW